MLHVCLIQTNNFNVSYTKNKDAFLLICVNCPNKIELIVYHYINQHITIVQTYFSHSDTSTCNIILVHVYHGCIITSPDVQHTPLNVQM